MTASEFLVASGLAAGALALLGMAVAAVALAVKQRKDRER